MHREDIEHYRSRIAQFQLELEKLRILVRQDLEELNANDRRRLQWPRIRDWVTVLVDTLGELRGDLAGLTANLPS
jgi:hypothetical protein